MFRMCYLLLNGDAGDVRIGALVPVEEAFHVDGVANVEALDGLVNLRGGVVQVGLDGEVVGLVAGGGVEVQVVAFLARAIVVVEEGNFLARGVLGRGNGQVLEGDLLVLVLDELIAVTSVAGAR